MAIFTRTPHEVAVSPIVAPEVVILDSYCPRKYQSRLLLLVKWTFPLVLLPKWPFSLVTPTPSLKWPSYAYPDEADRPRQCPPHEIDHCKYLSPKVANSTSTTVLLSGPLWW